MLDNITIQLDPLDTLFFKDGKPFSMGEETWADGIFPPPPSVLYGVLRTQYLSENPELSIENIKEKTTDLDILKIYYRFLSEEEKRRRGRSSSNCYLPLPADLVERSPKKVQADETDEDYAVILKSIERKENREKNYEVVRMPVCKLSDSVIASTQGNSVYPHWIEEGTLAEGIEGGFLEEKDMRSYLTTPEVTSFHAKKMSDYLKVESKTGIKRNRATRTTSDDGDLYRVGMRRSDGFQIEVTFKPLKDLKVFQNGGSSSVPVRLGAEGKVSAAKVNKDDLLGDFSGVKTAIFRVYLATPAIILSQENAPVIPDLQFLGVPVTYLGAAIKKTQMLGGFDMKTGQPKPMYRVIPAGSVFFFKADEVIDFDPFQGRKISDVGVAEGFGIVYFGSLKIDEI